MSDPHAHPRPSGAYTDAMRRAGAPDPAQADPALQMAEQLRTRFAQPVLDCLIILELGLLSTEPELANVEVPTITVQQIMETMKARAARAGA